MAYDVIEGSKNALDVLSKASEMTSKFTAVSTTLEITQKLYISFVCFGAVFGLTEGLVPVEKHNEILRCFEKLYNKVYIIDQGRDDIKKLEHTIKWESTQLQFGDVVDRINLGMQYCLEIGKRNRQEEKAFYQQRFKEFCDNQNFTHALKALLDGMTGTGVFRKSILDEFYSETNGDREKISALATRLLQLVCGGMVVISAYETVMRGQKLGIDEVFLIRRYEDQLKEVCAKVQSVIDGCVAKFEENMLTDLKTFIEKGGSNEGLVIEVSDFIRDKYDWLENFCLVYNDIHGFDQQCMYPCNHAFSFFGGQAVCSGQRSGKCGIVFYRTKGECPKFSDRYEEAYQVVRESGIFESLHTYDNIVAGIGRIGVGWTGCAMIARPYDLRSHGTFSTKIVRFDRTYFAQFSGGFDSLPKTSILLLE